MILLDRQQDMRRPPPICNEDRTGKCGFFCTPGILVKSATGKRRDHDVETLLHFTTKVNRLKPRTPQDYTRPRTSELKSENKVLNHNAECREARSSLCATQSAGRCSRERDRQRYDPRTIRVDSKAIPPVQRHGTLAPRAVVAVCVMGDSASQLARSPLSQNQLRITEPMPLVTTHSVPSRDQGLGGKKKFPP